MCGRSAMAIMARTRCRQTRMRAMHRARMQHPRVAEYSGEPERKERGEGASPGRQALHDPQKIGMVGQRAPAQKLVRSTYPGTDTPWKAIRYQ